MGKVAYYASRISPNQFETPTEGYRICKNVPICRTGHQEYLGRELKGHPSYEPGWGMEDGEVYSVHRPLDEVTCPETIGSAEGKSIVDEHPDESIAPGSLISRETERELGCGHVQNVRAGEPLANGETPLVADMHIKDDALIDKVDGGTRDISCGYTYMLCRLPDGSLKQTNIRINHVAVVPKGRAGPDVAIKDALPPEFQTKQERKPIMDYFQHVIGLGSKALAATAEPEDFATAMRRVNIALSATRDAATEEKKVGAKSTKDEESDDRDATIAELRAEIVELKKKAMPDKDKKVAKDDAVDDLEDLHEDLETLKEDIVEKSGDAVEEKKDAEADDDADVIDPEDEKAAKDAAKVKGAMDSARDLVKAFKPLVARGTASKAQRDAYNGAVKSLNAVKGVAATDAYAALAKVKGPDMSATARSAAQDADNPMQFYNGVPYEEGKRRHDAHLAAKKAGQ